MGKITSIITNDTKHCIECGGSPVEPHHVLHGYANRRWSEKFHLVVPMCRRCHSHLHENPQMDVMYMKMGQLAFEREYPDLNFKEIFGKNYK